MELSDRRAANADEASSFDEAAATYEWLDSLEIRAELDDFIRQEDQRQRRPLLDLAKMAKTLSKKRPGTVRACRSFLAAVQAMRKASGGAGGGFVQKFLADNARKTKLQ